ncbi:MAG: flagellar hook-basal body complex protein FliE [Wigglesworthia glossinidia]|nr:flagellar hook-basal body complex protein FliE [Wigglesworthia glossinidia]
MNINNKILDTMHLLKSNLDLEFNTDTQYNLRSKSFLSIFSESIKKINALEARSENTSKKFELGSRDVELHDVVLDMQKASIALHFGIQATNKLIGAYQEIMNMNI